MVIQLTSNYSIILRLDKSASNVWTEEAEWEVETWRDGENLLNKIQNASSKETVFSLLKNYKVGQYSNWSGSFSGSKNDYIYGQICPSISKKFC